MNESRGPVATGGERPEAAARIREAALEELVEQGAASLAMHDVADRAGVSKGLIHYHFHDKNALLADVAPALAARIRSRARAALSRSTTASAIADLSRWVGAEIEAGEWRALLTLADSPAIDVRRAAQGALHSRREDVEQLLARLFSLLGIRSRVARPPLTDLAVAAISGLCVQRNETRDHAAAVDALVLALYKLTD